MTCVKDHIINENEDYEHIGLSGFGYKLFEEKEGGVTREGLYEYTYLKYIIKLWPGGWVKHIEKLNEAVVIKNCFTMNGGGKRLVHLFKSQEF